MNDSNPPKPKLRWYQFSLRTLLLFTLFVAIGFSCLGHRIQRIRNEISATAELESLEVGIRFYSHMNWNELPIPDRWLWKYYAHQPAQCILLDETLTTDTELECIERLTSLQELEIVQVTDAGLEHLKGLTSLQMLSLGDTQITDAGLEHLEGLTNLQYLDLYGTQITDAGLEHLERLTNLQDLDLYGTQITDTGLEHLKGLTNLQDLDLTRTQVSDDGVDKLEEALPNCQISH